MFKNRSFNVKVVKDSDNDTNSTDQALTTAANIVTAQAYAAIAKDVVNDVVTTVVVGTVVVVGFKTACAVLLYATRALTK